jgi:hypothetical protein
MTGAWAGAIVSTNKNGVYVTVSQEKWDKTTEMIAKTVEKVEAFDGWLSLKHLERW